MDQDVVEFSDEEIVTPPSPTVVSREAENLGITGSTDDEVFYFYISIIMEIA